MSDDKISSLYFRELEESKRETCPDCGQPAMMEQDGLMVCGNCGEVI